MGLLISDGGDKVGLKNDTSRIGFKGSEDLGNGLSAIYHYEMGYNADNKTGHDLQTRIGMVGLKGSFGKVIMGNLWIPTYLLVDGKYDSFNHFGSKGSIGFRAGDAIAYVNKFGSVTVAAAIVASDADTADLVDATNIAVSFPAGPLTVGVGSHSVAATSTSGTTVTVAYKGNGFGATFGYTDKSDLAGDKITTLMVTAKVGSGKVLVRSQSLDAAGLTGVTLGYHMNLSKRTQVYIENASADVAGDGTIIGLKHNF